SIMIPLLMREKTISAGTACLLLRDLIPGFPEQFNDAVGADQVSRPDDDDRIVLAAQQLLNFWQPAAVAIRHHALENNWRILHGFVEQLVELFNVTSL